MAAGASMEVASRTPARWMWQCAPGNKVWLSSATACIAGDKTIASHPINTDGSY